MRFSNSKSKLGLCRASQINNLCLDIAFGVFLGSFRAQEAVSVALTEVLHGQKTAGSPFWGGRPSSH